MKTVDLYSKLKNALGQPYKKYEIFDNDPELKFLSGIFRSFKLDFNAIREWLESPIAKKQAAVAEAYLSIAPSVVNRIESVLGTTLPGTLVWMPSFNQFDGFARYELGEHNVLLGIDFPAANVDYLKVLTAHELSHVYRDHSPEVWKHLRKPLKEVTRQEYLDATEAQEHLASEGLATLFSQMVYPEVKEVIHHYYEDAEWEWCQDNAELIQNSITACLKEDEDVWSYYAPSRVAKGSPSRTQYFWAAKVLRKRLEGVSDPVKALIELHQKPAVFFDEFKAVK